MITSSFSEIFKTLVVESLHPEHNRNNGRYYEGGAAKEMHLDHVMEHPLVKNFADYHGNYGAPPYDYRQRKNMGVWTHPVTGKEHIVARDHGFSLDVQKAYQSARRRQVDSESMKRHIGRF